MDWQIIVALVIAIPIILFPVAFVWYLNFDTVVAAVREWRRTHFGSGRRTTTAAEPTEKKGG
jgi:hypothetical protein